MSDNKNNTLSKPIAPPLLAALVLVLLSVAGKLTGTESSNENFFLTISVIQLAVFAFPCIIYYFLKGRRLGTPMLIAPVKPRHFLFVLFSFMTLVTGTILIKFFYYLQTGSAPSGVSFLSLNEASTSNADVFSILIAFVIIPAVCEELFFRGIILSEYRRFGSATAVIFSAVCFSLAHFSFEAIPIYLFSGIILGICACSCRSVFAPILLHIGSNILTIYTSDRFLRVTIQKCGAFFVFFVITVAFLISLLLMLSRAEGLLWAESEKPSKNALPNPSSGMGFKASFTSPAFFVLVFVFVLITILL